ncbi:MAG: hypothetical protein NVSMB38_10970 [Ktedonobacteraceae bacterium]
MNEEVQKQSREITLPIEWHVPDTIQNRYVHNVLIQPGKYELALFFFETQIPPFAGTPEENREYLLKKGSIRSECIAKLTVAPEMASQIIKALQEGLENYSQARANEERGQIDE